MFWTPWHGIIYISKRVEWHKMLFNLKRSHQNSRHMLHASSRFAFLLIDAILYCVYDALLIAQYDVTIFMMCVSAVLRGLKIVKRNKQRLWNRWWMFFGHKELVEKNETLNLNKWKKNRCKKKCGNTVNYDLFWLWNWNTNLNANGIQMKRSSNNANKNERECFFGAWNSIYMVSPNVAVNLFEWNQSQVTNPCQKFITSQFYIP